MAAGEDPGDGQTGTAQPPILIFGTFDVRNYGDLLFPVIARWRLADSGRPVRSVSPTGADPRWSEAVPPISLERLLAKVTQPAGVLIGGGNIVHAERTRLPDYRQDDLPQIAYPQLWLGASILAAAHDVPIAWNAPGVIPGLALPKRTLTHVLEAADYLSVRDQGSADALPSTQAVVVPDTALDIARMWPRDSLMAEWQALLERKGVAANTPCLFVHAKLRSVEDIDALAEQLDAFSAGSGLMIVLGAIGPCHGDDVLARRISLRMRRAHLCLDDPTGLREIAAALAWSEGYLGNSLHGFITATAYQRPAALMVAKLHKFAGFASHVGQASALVAGWEEGLNRMRARPAAVSSAVLDGLHLQLDAHWSRVKEAMASSKARRAQRIALLRYFVRSSAKQGGGSWLLRPLLTRPTAPVEDGGAPSNR